MMDAITLIQSYVRMRLVRSRFKQRQYKHSNDMIIKELHRHPKFSRVCLTFFFVYSVSYNFLASRR